MIVKLDNAQQQFTGEVKRIRLDEIRPSSQNPRGPVDDTDASFERLTASIKEVGLLVPLVVKRLPSSRDGARYELVDGERRYWAARRLRLVSVPSHVLDSHVQKGDLRKLMFHLHMTREQWVPLAQCNSLDEVYPAIRDGIPFDDKPRWTARLSEEMGMNKRTARDRVRMLCWPSALKRQIYDFNEAKPSKDIYSYVLALEASVIEPSVTTFPNFYNHDRSKDDAINDARGQLLGKTLDSLTFGALISREQIRDIKPLFSELPPNRRNAAQKILESLVSEPDYFFHDAVSDIQIKLPEALLEKPPKPRTVIAAMKSMTRTLESYDPKSYLDSSQSDPRSKKLRKDFETALDDLIDAAESLRGKMP
jgi:ParB-like nuclease domain